MFLIMFKTGHALLLPGGRFPCPRSGGVENAEWSRDRAGSWPQTRHSRVLDSDVNWPRPHTMRACGQSMSPFNPRQQACQRMFRDLDKSLSLSVREQAFASDANYSSPVRVRELFMSANVSHSRNVQAPLTAAQGLHRRIFVFALLSVNFPFHIQTIYDL